MTEGLQVPTAVQDPACQSLSQPYGCQLPLHKGAKGCRTNVRRMTGTAGENRSASNTFAIAPVEQIQKRNCHGA